MDQNVGKNNKIHFSRALVIAILFAGCLFLLWHQNKKQNNFVVNTSKEESFLVVKTINEQSDYSDIDVQIPQFKNASPEFNKKIENSVNELINEHKTETAENWQARLATLPKGETLPEKPIDPNDRMYFYAKFDTPDQNNQNYISVLVRYGGYTGGAHPFEEFITYNYDVKNKKELVLADLFINETDYLTKISNIARQELLDKFINALGDFDSKSDRDDQVKNIKQMLYEGTDPNNPENFSNFTFNNSELTIYFGQYQVAPYVYGMQTVKIPLPL